MCFYDKSVDIEACTPPVNWVFGKNEKIFSRHATGNLFCRRQAMRGRVTRYEKDRK